MSVLQKNEFRIKIKTFKNNINIYKPQLQMSGYQTNVCASKKLYLSRLLAI